MKHFICILILGTSFLWCSSQTQHLHSSRIGLSQGRNVLNDHFGMVYEPIVTMERVVNLGDSAALVHFAKGGRIYEYYQVDHHPIFNNKELSLKDLKERFPEVKDWVGFETRTQDKEKKQEFMPFSIHGFSPSPLFILIAILLSAFGLYHHSLRNEVLV